ncbi:hypothetical protein T492DRAFT_498728 [Pavlovales sp. CCMP2436]|nr:hypothetical protein T492DRAFT_498728 [Pavlovales sp. CCMP2436]
MQFCRLAAVSAFWASATATRSRAATCCARRSAKRGRSSRYTLHPPPQVYPPPSSRYTLHPRAGIPSTLEQVYPPPSAAGVWTVGA